MNNSTDPVFEALDRLARVVDSSPAADDPMPGITRKARARRRRTAALTAGGVAAVVAAGFGVVSAVEVPGLSAGPEIAGPPTTSPAPILPSPDTPTPSPDTSSPTPETQAPDPVETPSPDEDVPTVPGRPDLVEYDRARADVDGDGAEDVVRVTFPTADVRSGGERLEESILGSDDVRLQVERAAADTVEVELEPAYVSVRTRDLDGDGTAEVVLELSQGGESASIRVLTWEAGTLTDVKVADDSPIDLEVIVSSEWGEELNTELREIGLISWRHLGEEAVPPYEVRLWTWELDGTQLVAIESEQTRCMDPDRYRTPGTYPEPC